MSKLIPSSLYGALVLFLFLPFIHVKCNQTILAESSGIKVIAGSKPSFKDNSMESYMSGQGDMMENMQKQNKPNPVLIVFSAMLVLGLIFSLLAKKDLHLGNTVFSGIALLSLLAFLGQIIYGNQEINKQMGMMQTGFMKLNISIKMAYGYWLSLISTLGLLAFSIIWLIKERKQKKLMVHYKQAPDNQSPDEYQQV